MNTISLHNNCHIIGHVKTRETLPILNICVSCDKSVFICRVVGKIRTRTHGYLNILLLTGQKTAITSSLSFGPFCSSNCVCVCVRVCVCVYVCVRLTKFTAGLSRYTMSTAPLFFLQ